MIEKNNIHQLFKALDQALGEKQEQREITLFGSGPLIALNIIDRQTMDIDMVEPEIDITLQLIAADVGEKFDLRMTWLNSAGHIFSSDLPVGWKQRAKVHFKGENLNVKFLDRFDLIATKFHAACQRVAQDVDDLVSMKPKNFELVKAKQWTLKRNNGSDWVEQVEKVMETLKRKLKE